jgi:hypothetical protein
MVVDVFKGRKVGDDGLAEGEGGVVRGRSWNTSTTDWMAWSWESWLGSNLNWSGCGVLGSLIWNLDSFQYLGFFGLEFLFGQDAGVT